MNSPGPSVEGAGLRAKGLARFVDDDMTGTTGLPSSNMIVSRWGTIGQ